MTVPHIRQLRLDVADLCDEFGTDEQHRRLAVGDDEGDLGPGEAPIDRRHHHPGLHRAHQQLEIDVAVLAEIGDPLARLDAERDQRVGNAVGVDVEFGESWSGALRIHRPARSQASWRGRAPCRQGSSVAAKRTCLSRSVLLSLHGVWRHHARKTIRQRIGVPRMLRSALGIALRATSGGALLFRGPSAERAVVPARGAALHAAPRSGHEFTPLPRGPSRSVP